MGVCYSKRRESSYPDIVPSNDQPKGSKVKEENETSEAAEFAKGTTSLTTNKVSCVAEGEDKKTGETPVKQSAQLKEDKGSKAAATVTTPLRTSSCTNEEVDAILIQCGRLSRNSSGKSSNEMAGQRRPSGSKKSYDFDNDVKEEGEAFDKSTSRPSPRRRTRSGSRERGSMGVRMEKESQSTRSRSPVNNARKSNENAQSQSLSRCSSRKADESPLRRNPMAEIDENSLINHIGANVSTLQSSREVDNKAIQSQIIHLSIFQQAKKAEIVKESGDAKFNTGVENLNPLAQTKTRSSRGTSCDLDKNPVLKPTSFASFMLEDIQNHQQNIAFSFPTGVSKASSCSEQRSYETDQSNNKSFLKSEFARRVPMVQRETSKESELEVKNDPKKPSIHKYVTARNAVPQESAGSNSFIGEPWDSSLPCNALEEEAADEVGQKGKQWQKRSWASSQGNSSHTKAIITAATPLGKKFDHRQLHQSGQVVGCGNGTVDGRAISVRLSAATSCTGEEFPL
ncbi:hypothetical protein IEQ34_019890 [Dendrobium chrysotoxum]|uniref:Uncharacterized protein n=1 Tax=Dendrobium chrysotoxum TaxID=161865 RepID=A0AAV7G895_DENCH|nr:hypothetical protein IEQ34_019890 [Dendrobium chrysotoxum]